jgi:carboxyl-terminal processing protease
VIPPAARPAATAALIVLGIVGAVSPAVAQQPDSGRSPLRKRTAFEDLQMFSQVLNQIRVNHPDSVDTHELMLAAVEGMVAAADPHSYVIPAIRLAPDRERAWREGKLYPVPIDFRMLDGAALVASVASGSRAAALDILPGDELVAVDGKAVTAHSAAELEITLAGPRRTSVTLSLERRRTDGSYVRLERVVERERVEEESAIPAAFMLDSLTGYIRVTTFAAARVADDLQDALRRLEKQGMRRVVLDLRNNGGGLITEAAKVAGAFLPEGTVVYRTVGRKPEQSQTGKVARAFWRSERAYPVALLVNEGTASASELLAGALQDHDRALIVGRPTFGKALLMQTFPMTDGSTFVLVTGHVKTPCGRVLQRQYRQVSRRDYYRLTRAERDTAGRPSCTTAKGRTVYGGGGIYPDVLLPSPDAPPRWLEAITEEALVTKWLGGWLTEHGTSLTSADVLLSPGAIPGSMVTLFRQFAASQGVVIPNGADIEARLTELLRGAVARTKFGTSGYFRVRVATDPEVHAALRALAAAPTH